MSNTVVWLRRDLRVDEQPALRAAIELGNPIIPLFIWSPEEEAPWQPGAASQWWLHHSLERLAEEYDSHGSRLLLRQGSSKDVLDQLIDDHDVSAVFWNRRYEPAVIKRDEAVKTHLESRDIHAQSFNGALLVEPWEINTKQGKPYQVFTPFWKTIKTMIDVQENWQCPQSLSAPSRWPESDNLTDFELLPTIPWDECLADAWTPGTVGARAELNNFLSSRISGYQDDRNRPDLRGSSRLSPHLHFGEISIREVYREAERRAGKNGVLRKSGDVYLSELGWREFAHHLLYHFPRTVDEPLRERFADFPWEKNKAALKKWQRGETGYPIVDAGLRELWQTGWMHNRVRMIVASFLCKDLRIGWQEGAAWFWDTLVDADLASNTLGWQWTAGCGADAAPYFRVFNPTTQAAKFDPNGHYIKQFCPELAALEGKKVFEPWKVEHDLDYCPPMVDHAEAREIALAAYET
ncbi:MAG: deoxyribodipyrimidine photo-lyase, partial [Planctomycetaceae bacterium]|nr:deoxyribodipyrimidine photo-lyase [Planctomycetaceae bacterium]